MLKKLPLVDVIICDEIDIEKDLNISYPTVKKTLDEIISALGFEKINVTESKKLSKEEVYRALKNGEITFEQAEEYLKEDYNE